MSDPTQSASPLSEWGASDALVLEGLSGLDELVDLAEDQSATIVSRFDDTIRLDDDEFSIDSPEISASMPGFRSARELRAAKERVAAEKRSAARREGNTQALGLTALETLPAMEVKRSPRPAPTPSRLLSPSTPVSVTEPKRVEVENGSKLLEDAMTARVRPTTTSTAVTEPTVGKAPEPRARDSKTRVEELNSPRRRSSQEASVEEIPTRSRVTKSPPEQRVITPQMDAPLVRRRHGSGSSFFPAVLTSVFVTSLVWGGVLFSFWHFLGDEWFSKRIQDEATPLRAGLKDELEVGSAKLKSETLSVEGQVVELRTRYEKFVRMNALEAALYADNSKQKFADLLEIGRTLPTGSSEEEFFIQTKGRVESAYSKRIARHPGLNVRRLFPSLGITRETSAGKTTLMNFIAKSGAPGWDRARAAHLLQGHPKDEKVIAFLRERIREDEDIQVVFAAWDSLVVLSGYEVGSKGFQPGDFDRWLSTQG